MDYKQKYLKYKNKYLELKKMSGGFLCIHDGKPQYGQPPNDTISNNPHNFCNQCGNWLCYHIGTTQHGNQPNETFRFNYYNYCNDCGSWLCLHNNTIYYGNLPEYVLYNVRCRCGQSIQDVAYAIDHGITLPVPMAPAAAAVVPVAPAAPVAAAVVPVAPAAPVAAAVVPVAPAAERSGPFTIVNNNYCVFDAAGTITLHPRGAKTDITHDQPNRALSAYFTNLHRIYGNSINVEAYLYPFNHPDDVGVDAAKHIKTTPIHLSRITISNYSTDVVRELLQALQRLPALPADTFLLGVAYTNAIKVGRRWQALPPGPNNGEFLDVQLCVSGKIKQHGETHENGAVREIQEECGLNVNVIGTPLTPVVHPPGRQYILNATPATLQINTVIAKDTRFDAYGDHAKVATMIYGDLAFLQSLITSALTRTDIDDVQGIVLIRLT